MSSRAWKDNELLRHVPEAIGNVGVHQASGSGKFTIQRAIIYELVIIGEAVGDLSKTLKESYPQVPWQTIADTRHKMVHDYEEVASRVVWDIVENHLPELRAQVEAIIKKLEN